MESKEITVSSIADALAAVASLEYADCMLKARRHFPQVDGEMLKAGVEVAVGRIRVKELVPQLAQGFFTKKGLQQRTHPAVAAYHASLFRGCRSVLEVGCGLGFDTMALAGTVLKLTSLEKDSHTAFCASRNIEILGLNNVQIRHCGFEDLLCDSNTPIESFDGIWADPDRRKEGRRTRDADSYDPPLGSILSLPITVRQAVKIAPGTDPGVLPPGWVTLWIGFDGECKERILIYSPLVDSDRVVCIDEGYTWVPGKDPRISLKPLPECSTWYLCEPHSALVASGYVNHFFGELGLERWDEVVPYGLSLSPVPPNPLVTRFLIEEVLPFDIKKLSVRLAAQGWDTRTEIKKRSFPEEPDVIRKKLKLGPYVAGKSHSGVVFLTSRGKKLIAILGKRLG